MAIDSSIFKAYDVRGVVDKTLTQEAIHAIAFSYGEKARQQGVKEVTIGRDGRLSSPKIAHILAQGLMEMGLTVKDVGEVTTPMLYFAAYHHTQGSGIMVTGSHNPPEYNGLKFMLAGQTLAGETIRELYTLTQNRQIVPAATAGQIKSLPIENEYILAVQQRIKLNRPMNIIIDAGNGVAGAYAGALYRALGAQVEELFCTVDGTFPHHHPDPSQQDNLQDLIRTLRTSDAELGLAFDGDGDRLGVVTQEGEIIYPDRLLMLLSEDVLSRCPGGVVVYDIKCTRLLAPWIKNKGGQPVLSRTGHSYIKGAMQREKALIAGEMSGHLFFSERWFGFDDGLYAGARILEILSKSQDISKRLHALPQLQSTPEITLTLKEEGRNHEIIKQLQKNPNFPGAENIITLDGLRVEYKDGFGLVRASNTTPSLVLRFEGKDQDTLQRIKEVFYSALSSFVPDLDHYFSLSSPINHM